MKIAFFDSIYATKNELPKLKTTDMTWDSFVDALSKAEVGTKFGPYFIRGGELKANFRVDENLLSAELVIIDADRSKDNNESAPDPKLVHEALKSENITHLIYPSFSNNPPDKIRYRVVIPCKLDDSSQLRKCVNWVISLLNIKNIPIVSVKENYTWTQPWFFPALREKDQPYDIYHFKGEDLKQTEVPDSYASRDDTREPETKSSDSLYYKDAIKEILDGGAGHTNIVKFGNACARNGTPKKTCINMLEVIIDSSKWDQEKKDDRKSMLNKNISDCYNNIANDPDSNSDYYYDGIDSPKGDESALKIDENLLIPKDKLIGKLAECLKYTWWVPNSMIASLAARSIVAYLAGGSYKGALGDRVNLQQCVVGESGCGKDLLVNSVSAIIQYVFMDDMKLMNSLAKGVIDEAGSAEGLDDRMRSVGKKHDLIFVRDEIGEMIQQASKGNQFKAGILSYFLKMYTKSNSVSNERAISRKGKESSDDIVLYAPHFILSGATTPDLITDGLNGSFVTTGVMSRMMLFNASVYKENPLRRVLDLELPIELIMNLRKLVDTGLVEDKLHHLPSARIYNPKTVEFPEDVVNYCYDELVIDMNRKENKEVWNRRVPNAKKYAMCEAILENPDSPVVDLDNIKRQMEFVTESCKYIIMLFSECVGESDSDTVEKALLARAKEKEGLWVKRAYLTNIRQAKKVDKRILNTVLDSLVIENYLDIYKIKNKRGKESLFYRYGLGKSDSVFVDGKICKFSELV